MHRNASCLKKYPPFGRLSRDDLYRLAHGSELQRVKRNSVIYCAHDVSDRIYVICEGRIKLSRSSPEGREVVLEVLVTGELFGELAVCGEKLRTHSAIAIDDALVCAVRRQEFATVIGTSTSLALEVLRHIGERRNDLELRLEDLLFLPVEQRLVLTLLRQADRHGIREADGSISVYLIQKDLAHLVSASRETVAEFLAVYKKTGLLKTGYRSIRLLDLEGIMALLQDQVADGSGQAAHSGCVGGQHSGNIRPKNRRTSALTSGCRWLVTK